MSSGQTAVSTGARPARVARRPLAWLSFGPSRGPPLGRCRRRRV